MHEIIIIISMVTVNMHIYFNYVLIFYCIFTSMMSRVNFLHYFNAKLFISESGQ